MVVLDTCTLFWWVAMPDRLSPRAAEACREMESKGGVVSSICFWEIGVKAKKGKLALGVSFDTFCDRVESTGILEIVPVDLRIWRVNLGLEWNHRDPVDRTVVATAKLRELPILTADQTIRAYYPNTIW